MNTEDYQVPSLASVLQTLASIQAQNQTIPPQSLQSPHPALENSKFIYPPPQLDGLGRDAAGLPAKKVVDPATITEWSAGLRCVMKTVAAHDNIIKEIRRMIKVQHEHEEEWWKGRQDLLRKQEARIEGQKKLDEVLKAVGGTVTQSQDDPAEELKTFDMKVYRAQFQMVREMSAKLKSFGVPFFLTRTELVRKPGDKPGDPAAEEKKIDEAELVELQRRMIAILEDLCND